MNSSFFSAKILILSAGLLAPGLVSAGSPRLGIMPVGLLAWPEADAKAAGKLLGQYGKDTEVAFAAKFRNSVLPSDPSYTRLHDLVSEWKANRPAGTTPTLTITIHLRYYKSHLKSPSGSEVDWVQNPSKPGKAGTKASKDWLRKDIIPLINALYKVLDDTGDDTHLRFVVCEVLEDQLSSANAALVNRTFRKLFGQQLAVTARTRAGSGNANAASAEAHRILDRFSMRRCPIRVHTDFPASAPFNTGCSDYTYGNTELTLTSKYLSSIGVPRPSSASRDSKVTISLDLTPVENVKVSRTLETHSRFDDLGDAAEWSRGAFSNDGGFVGTAYEVTNVIIHAKTLDLRQPRCTVSEWKNKCRAALGDDDVLLLWREMYNGLVPGQSEATRTFSFGTTETTVLKEFLGIP